jgi:hypothetical protein
MTQLRVLLSRLRRLISRARLDADLLEDIETHLALLSDEYRRKGLSDLEARLAARKAFGGMEQTRLAVHDVRGFVWVEEAAQDLCDAFRMLARTPLFRTFEHRAPCSREWSARGRSRSGLLLRPASSLPGGACHARLLSRHGRRSTARSCPDGAGHGARVAACRGLGASNVADAFQR